MASEICESGSSNGSSTDSSSSSSDCSSDDDRSDNPNTRENSRTLKKRAVNHSCKQIMPLSPDTTYASEVQEWTVRIPIGLGLCPWAGQSHSQGRLRYVTYEGCTPSDVAQLIVSEAERLVDAHAPPLSSALIVCPHVGAWSDFQVFYDWVDGFNEELNGESIHDNLTFVSFHPKFLRWRGLPADIKVGSVVQSCWGVGGRKSIETAPATIVEAGNKVFGMQKVKVRFHDILEERRPEQYVPIDWFDHSVGSVRPPLPDNAMHRAPHPTIHLIRNSDMASLCLRTVSRVKRKNRQLVMKLGWQGVDRHLPRDSGFHMRSCQSGVDIELSTKGSLLLLLQQWYVACNERCRLSMFVLLSIFGMLGCCAL